MQIKIATDKQELGRQATEDTTALLQKILHEKGHATLILATGASQFETLKELVKADIDWSKVTFFHLDEYIGLPEEHPASFRKYLKERFQEKVDGADDFHFVNGDADDPKAECQRLGALIKEDPIDLALVGIGENGHLAFNDPPADFKTDEPYLIVDLDEQCRKQQLGEGWFASLDEVPKQAISMSIKQIMKASHIICSVPDERKAQAVHDVLIKEISPEVPASILREHPSCWVYLDKNSAEKLPEDIRSHD